MNEPTGNAWTDRVADWAALLVAHIEPYAPRSIAPPRPGGDAALHHREWRPLAERFVSERGVDYGTFQRVRRLLEAHLDRLSDARPQTWRDDEQLAFYINAYNALVIHQVLLHYPVRSIQEIPAAFARPYPVGPENLSLHQILHGKIRRLGDPRAYAAVVPAARGAPLLRVYTPDGLESELDEQFRHYLHATTTAYVQGSTANLTVPKIVRSLAPLVATPHRASALARTVGAYLDPARAIPYLQPFLPDDIRAALEGRAIRLAFRTFDWTLNDAG